MRGRDDREFCKYRYVYQASEHLCSNPRKNKQTNRGVAPSVPLGGGGMPPQSPSLTRALNCRSVLSDWESVQGSGFNAHNTVPVSESRGRTSGENQLNILLIYQSDRMPLHNSAICIQSTVHIYGSD